MAIQESVSVRNASLDVRETTIGASPRLQIRTGAQPANCAAADTGTLLIEYILASDWAAAASAGSKSFLNVPVSGTATGAGTAAHYRIKDNAGTTCHEQGSVSTSGGDVTIDNATIVIGQTVNVTGWTKTAPHA